MEQKTTAQDACRYDGVVLFSGGLDSLLSAMLLQKQGLRVKCLHFISPFFGKPHKLEHWREVYGLDIDPVDIIEEYSSLLRKRPVYGFGSVLNPCVDCKILMMRRAREIMELLGGRFIASGEVLGQRPMSQRRDTLNVIRRDGDVKGLLLRPLCAKLLDPTQAELDGLVAREKLLAFSGRGRKNQLALAAEFGIKEIPTPGGGCLLTETESARSYWAVLKYTKADGNDFRMAGTGRQYWHIADGEAFWLCVGKNKDDNEAMLRLSRPGDIVLKLRDYPGPIAVARASAAPACAWPQEALRSAAELTASFSTKAHKEAGGKSVTMLLHEPVRLGVELEPSGAFPVAKGDEATRTKELEVIPCREPAWGWSEFNWYDAKSEITDEARHRTGNMND